ncbi:MAG: AAA family ATPase, partial [Pseudomonadota bacterium]
MHITEVRIAGFKSFVDPQDLPVEPGLTGIVGPNGCGKSNLLEALRWAMGANSARAMRGGEMDDLIFSGSSDRPARETAEVTLVLDNSSRTAPAEFNDADTLEVLRKLRRGAGSTYKLNGRTVRGKDIQLLFADASTGANSPALVRQGQISELIGAKPQNRRRILEEAAGIGGLNARRHDAELKLNQAEANLERLTEVSAEVERQLESLKRQARKARKYKALSEEIAALEAWSAHLKWTAATQEHAAAKTALDAAKADVEARTRADAMAEKTRIEASEGLAPLRDAETLAAARLGQARIALATLETERRGAEETARRLADEAARLAADVEREQSAKDEAETAAQTAQTDLAALPIDDPGQADAQEAKTRAELDAAREALKRAEARADAARAALSEARARRDAIAASTATQTRRKDQLTSDAERLTADLAAIADAGQLTTALMAARASEEDAEAAARDADAAVERCEMTLETARKAESDAEGPFQAAKKNVSALEAELAGLDRLLRRAE